MEFKGADDESVMRCRLITRSSWPPGSVEANPSIIMHQIINWLESIESNEKDEEQTQCYETILWSLESLLFDAQKAAKVKAVCAAEEEEYRRLHAEIDTKITQTSDEISMLKTQLQEEMTHRKYKEEYESIAKVVNTLPSRDALQQEMQKEEQSMAIAQSEMDEISGRMETRSKQFDLLVRTIHDLQQTLKEDVLKENLNELEESKDEESLMEEGQASPPPRNNTSTNVTPLPSP